MAACKCPRGLRDDIRCLDIPGCPGIVSDVETWLPIVNDVRTALAEDSLPIETMKELLAAA